MPRRNLYIFDLLEYVNRCRAARSSPREPYQHKPHTPAKATTEAKRQRTAKRRAVNRKQSRQLKEGTA